MRREMSRFVSLQSEPMRNNAGHTMRYNDNTNLNPARSTRGDRRVKVEGPRLWSACDLTLLHYRYLTNASKTDVRWVPGLCGLLELNQLLQMARGQTGSTAPHFSFAT
jgi:hypothetical protein